MSFLDGHKANFETMKRAFAAGHVALLECVLRSSGEKVAVVCMLNRDGGQIAFAPVAMLFNDNPYELLEPPQ